MELQVDYWLSTYGAAVRESSAASVASVASAALSTVSTALAVKKEKVGPRRCFPLPVSLLTHCSSSKPFFSLILKSELKRRKELDIFSR